MNFKTTIVKKTLIVSLIIFIIFLSTFPKDDIQNYPILFRLGVSSFLIFLWCSVILLYRLITRKSRQDILGNLEQDKVYCASSSKLTNIIKKVLNISLIIYGVYAFTYPLDGSNPNSIMLALGSIAMIVIFCCCAILFCQLIITRFR